MRLLFIGDVMLGRLVNDLLKSAPAKYPWGDTLAVFENADWRCCNLECVISDRGEPWSPVPKVFHFRSDTKNVAVLKKAKINAVSLANNHTLDYGYEAMVEMLEAFDRHKITHAGAGRNLAEAAEPALSVVNGVKIGVLAFTDNEPDWEATETRPGLFYTPIDVSDQRAEYLFERITETRKKVDLLIVSTHWGPNWGNEPPGEHIEFGHQLIDAGTDIIFGHSAHICRGIELYKGKPILYSTGDFIDDYAVDETERNDRSFLFDVEVEGTEVRRVELIPTVIRRFQSNLATGVEATIILGKMEELCRKLGTEAAQREGRLKITIGDI